MEDFTKVKLIEVPRNVVAGHDALGSIREMCENVHFGKTGTIITGTKTMDAAARDVLSYMDGYDIDVVQVGEASIENARIAITAEDPISRNVAGGSPPTGRPSSHPLDPAPSAPRPPSGSSRTPES